MREIPPFGCGSLAAEWPLLLECASPRPDPDSLRAVVAANLDWDVLLTLAEEHGTLALVGRKLRAAPELDIPRNVLQRLHDRRKGQIFFTLSMTSELLRLLSALSAEHVESLVVKGPVLSVQAYGDAGIRQYADVDLLVRHSEIQRATEVMIAAGYEADVPLSAIKAGRIPGEYL